MRTLISLTFGILLAYVAGSVLGTQVVLNNVPLWVWRSRSPCDGRAR